MFILFHLTLLDHYIGYLGVFRLVCESQDSKRARRTPGLPRHFGSVMPLYTCLRIMVAQCSCLLVVDVLPSNIRSSGMGNQSNHVSQRLWYFVVSS